MTMRLLPDANAYVHPRFSWLAMCLFDAVLGRLFRVECDPAITQDLPPGSLLVSNHVRDSDGPLLGRLVFRRRGGRLHGALPYFVMREDLYQPEALSNLLAGLPGARFLSAIRLRWLFANVRTFPLRRLREFTWHDVLRELVVSGQGADAPSVVFNPRGLRELRQCLGEKLPERVDAINPWRLGRLRVAWWGLRRLRVASVRRLAPGFRVTVDAQLRFFARQLDAGFRVYLAPEGGTSTDGRLGRIRAATWRLPRLAARTVPVVPFAFSYDPFGPGRTRVLVRRGPVLSGLGQQGPGEVRTQVQTAIRAQQAVTPSHLLAWFLCRGQGPFVTGDLLDWLQSSLPLLRATGADMDPLWTRQPLPRLVVRRLDWLRRARLVDWRDGRWHRRVTPAANPGWATRSAQAHFLANALEDRVSAFRGRAP